MAKKIASSNNGLADNIVQSIKGYEKDFRTLATFVEAVRTNIGMYLGASGDKGFATMIREIFQNAFDEMLRVYRLNPGYKFRIVVSYDENTHTVIVEDNGRGIPFNIIIRALTENHTSSNYTKEKGDFLSGLHGSGSKCVNAVSEYFIISSYILGEARQARFEEGFVTKEGLKTIPNKDNRQGTVIEFRPSTFMGTLSLTCEDILQFIKSMAYVAGANSEIVFNGIKRNGTMIKETFVNTDGLDTYLYNICEKPIVMPVHYQVWEDEYACDFTFTYDTSKSTNAEPTMIGYANYTPIRLGTSIDGFYKGIAAWFTKYMNNIYLNNNKKNLKININDIKTGLVVVLNTCKLKPTFVGQDKQQISDKELTDYVSSFVVKSLDQWAKDKPQDLQKVCKYLKDIAEVRSKSDDSKIKLSNSYTSSAIGTLPSKYVRPQLKKGSLELFIVEGDSALGSARNSRNPQYQGIMPIRGKIPNALTTARAKFLQNEEIAGICTILGWDGKGKFKLENCNYSKIVFLTDADSDGKHIATLLLIFIMVYMKPLIDDGRVFKAMPPLYGIKRGEEKIKTRNGFKKHDKMEYFINKLEYIKYCQKDFGKSNKIGSMSGNMFSNAQVTELVYNNMDYVYELETVANHYAFNPNLLELVVLNQGLPFIKLKKILSTQFPYLTYETKGSTLVIRGLIGNKYQTMFWNDTLKEQCEEISYFIHKVNKSNVHYNLNGNVATLYEVMLRFKAAQPKDITRYKGLGEMNPAHLGETTLNINNRSLIQYTFNNAEQEIEAIKQLQSNKDKLLELPGYVNVKRRDILG